jgi:TRAP-type C4-dicarboxylate transport system permease small subunit
MSDPNRADDRGAVDRFLRAYLKITRLVVMVVSCAVLGFMVAVNGLEIIGRGFFQTSFSWVQELSILAAMWIYFFAYALIAKNEEYIRVDFAVRLMPAAWRWRVDVFARLVTILFHAVVAVFAVEAYRFLGPFTTSVLVWPESLFVLPILLGAIDIVITEAIHLYWQLAGYPPSSTTHLLPAGTE